MPEGNVEKQHFEEKKEWWKNYTQLRCCSNKKKGRDSMKKQKE